MKQFCLLLVCIISLFRLAAQNASRGGVVSKSSPKTIGNTYAIVIGISKYKHIDSLQFANKDGQAFANFFSSKTGGSLPDSNIYLFLDEKATSKRVWEAISRVREKLKPSDRVYFYFAGHGDMEDVSQTDNGLLLMYESPNGNYFGPSNDVLQIRDLKLYLASLTEKGIQVIFIIDACHSGNLKGGIKGLESTAAALASNWKNEYKILSCQPNQLSFEGKQWGGGRGIFSLCLEEGLKGLADKNNDKKVSFRELQTYISDEVDMQSEGKQIPILTGDLSRDFVVVDSIELATLKEVKRKNYQLLSAHKVKSTQANYEDSLDKNEKPIYISYKKHLTSKQLIFPKQENAFNDYQIFLQNFPDNPLIGEMRITLASALTTKFDSIVAPIMRGGSSFSSRNTCDTVAKELDSCLKLLGAQHPMYNNILARKMYMEAMSRTWGIAEHELNSSFNREIEEAIKILEKSEDLEPSASYTILALGSRYQALAKFQKASEKFKKYLDLRPNDVNTKYSLGNTWIKLKQYKEASDLITGLIEKYPGEYRYYYQLFDCKFKSGDTATALATAKKVLEKFGKADGYEILGQYYSQCNNLNKAVYYYKLAKKESGGHCNICDNNIGYAYLTNHQYDSARYYFNLLIKSDSTEPFANHNLGMIEAINGNYRTAIRRFVYSFSTPVDQEAFQTHFEMFYNKEYRDTASENFKKFSNSVFNLSVQYASCSYILYCFLRDSELKERKDLIDTVFKLMRNYKEYEMFTKYHEACYKALKKESLGALKSLEEALKSGFGYYFMLANDADLDHIRNEPDFKALLRKYFPNEKN